MWSHLIQRDVTSPLFFLPLKLGRLGVGAAVQRHAAAPWRAWQWVIATLMATTQSPDTDTLFNTAPRLRAQLVQLQTTLSLQTNKPAFSSNHLAPPFAKKPNKKKRVTTIQRHFHKQFLESLTTSLVDRAVLLSQSTSHTGAHLMQPSSEAYEAEDRCFRVASARRLMLPHPAAPNTADVAQTCSNKSAAGQICTKPVDLQQHHCYGCRYGGGVDRRHAAVLRCSADVIHSQQWHQGVHRTGSASPHPHRERSAGRMRARTLFSSSTVPPHYWMFPLLLLLLATRLLLLQPAPAQDPWPRELRRANSTDIHTPTLSLSSLRRPAALDNTPENSSATS